MSDTNRPAPDDRIPFGDGPAQDLPANLAEAVLRTFWARSPDVFGMVVRAAMKQLWAPSKNGQGHAP
jgi:hypothetical protein